MTPEPDSPLQIPLQAAERLLELGVLPPWSVSAPLGPALIAGLAWLPGVSPGLALWLVILLAAALAAFGCAWLLRRRSAFRQAFLLILLTPMQWLLLTDGLDRFVFWRLGTLLIVLLVSPGRPAVRVGWAVVFGALLTLTLPSMISGLDVAALGEAAILLWFVSHRAALPAAASAAALVAFASLPSDGMPTALGAEARTVADGRVVGPRDITLEEVPLLREARRFILGGGDSRVALLWLRALGARHVVLRFETTSAPELPIDVVDSRGSFRLQRLSTPAPEAVLVSRSRLEALPPIRGLQDVEALEAYILWAGRLEAVGVDRNISGEIRLTTDVGPEDLLLLRQPLRPSLQAELRSGGRWTPAIVRADPIGFTVLEPLGVGRQEFRVRAADAWEDRLKPVIPDRPLLSGPFPAIAPGSVVDARAFTPSPFAAGDYLSVFGERFDLFEPRIRLNQRLIKPLFASATQVNFRLPEDLAAGSYEVRVESGGKQSLAELIEVQLP